MLQEKRFGSVHLAPFSSKLQYIYCLPCQLAGTMNFVIPDFTYQANNFRVYVHSNHSISSMHAGQSSQPCGVFKRG